KPHMTKKRGVKSRSFNGDSVVQAFRPASRVHVVGLISDTHGLVRPEIARALDGVAIIVHAGDVGGPHVLDALRRIAPVEAVYGNVDDPHDPSLAAGRAIPIGDLTLHVS